MPQLIKSSRLALWLNLDIFPHLFSLFPPKSSKVWNGTWVSANEWGHFRDQRFYFIFSATFYLHFSPHANYLSFGSHPLPFHILPDIIVSNKSTNFLDFSYQPFFGYHVQRKALPALWRAWKLEGKEKLLFFSFWWCILQQQLSALGFGRTYGSFRSIQQNCKLSRCCWVSVIAAMPMPPA